LVVIYTIFRIFGSALKKPKEAEVIEFSDGQLPDRWNDFLDPSLFSILGGISQGFRDYQFLNQHPSLASINGIHEAIEHSV